MPPTPVNPASHRNRSSRWKLALNLAGALIALQLLAYFGRWPWAYWLVALPGTIGHEAMHWLTAWVLQGQPRDFNVWPDWSALVQGGRYQLGSVQFAPNGYNAAMVALAPLLLVPISMGMLVLATRLRALWQQLLTIYLAASLLGRAWPSSADWQVAWSAPSSWPLALLVFGAGTWLGWRGLRGCFRRNVQHPLERSR